MEAILKTPQITFKLEADKPTELFKLIAETQEIFAESCCGLCGKSDLRFVAREVDGNTFYEMKCNSCGAKLAFGARKKPEGQLFPKRKLDKDGKPDMENGTYGKHRGWSQFKGTKEF